MDFFLKISIFAVFSQSEARDRLLNFPFIKTRMDGSKTLIWYLIIPCGLWKDHMKALKAMFSSFLKVDRHTVVVQFWVRFEQLPIQTMLKQAKADIFEWKASKKLSIYISSSFGKKMIFSRFFGL